MQRPSLTVDGRHRRLRLIQLGRLLTDGIKLVPYARALQDRRAKLVASQLEPTLPLLGELVTGAPTAAEKEERAKQREQLERRRLSGGGDGDKGKGKEAEGRGGAGGAGAGEEEEEVVWLHCSVGEPIEEGEVVGEKEQVSAGDVVARRSLECAADRLDATPPRPAPCNRPILQTTQITPLQGFDRLRDAGLSEEEIASMRAEFRASVGATGPVDGGEPHLAGRIRRGLREGG